MESNPYNQLDKELFMFETGYIRSRCLNSITKLNIAQLIDEKGKSVKELASLLQVHEGTLFRLLRLSYNFGLFEMIPQEKNKDEPVVESNTLIKHSPLSKLLVDSNRRDLAYLRSCNIYYDIWREFDRSLKVGKSNYSDNIGASTFWEITSKDLSFGKIFNNAMTGYSQKCIPLLMALGDYQRYNTIVDVGGSSGLFLDSILSSYPNVEKGINFDLKHVLDADTSNHDPKRFVKMEGNFFESVPEGCDLYILKSILHDWDDEKSCQILNNISKSMKNDSKIYNYEYVFTGDRNIDDFISMYDIHMFQVYSGKERTDYQFKQLALNSSLQVEKIIRVENHSKMIQSLIIMKK